MSKQILSHDEIASKMAQVIERNCVRFIEDLSNRIVDLERLREQLNNGVDQVATLEQLAFVSHRLSGISATVGYPEIGTLAAEVEHMVDAVKKGQQAPDYIASLMEWIDALLDQMEDVAVEHF